MTRMAETVQQANQQQWTLPTSIDDNWRNFARLINGYTIAEELKIDLMKWAQDTLQDAMQGDGFDGDVTILDLRLMLFAVYRSDYFTGYTYQEHNPQVDFILQALSNKTGQPYTPITS